MKTGFIFSDLHLFASHTNVSIHHTIQNAVPLHADYIVMNGDIFDFRWSHFINHSETLQQAKKWLEDMLAKFDKDIYYIMGNHDCGSEWESVLNTIQNPRFHWSSSHFMIDDKLFLHGDLALGKHDASPLVRTRMDNISTPRFYTLMNTTYDLLIESRVHKPISKYFTPERTSRIIYNSLEKQDSPTLQKVRDIYFGHTHHPFKSYLYKGKMFYNTGSAISHLTFNPLEIIHGQK